ncbi:translational protein [Lithospermum erythrorhizon]|uniref:Translational protein n=1 Tax=Lithospermum erythrorhizon TaxID=34254 RepID=A0AAV3NNN9_LITER
MMALNTFNILRGSGSMLFSVSLHSPLSQFLPITTTTLKYQSPNVLLLLSHTQKPFRQFCITTSHFSDEIDMVKIKEAANTLDMRVGRIVNVWRHPEADSLYVEEVDVGEQEPRTICSGLVKYIPLQHLQNKNVVVLANLKPRNMRGVKSNGMLMAASDDSHENVELLVPPEGSVPGEKIWFGSVDEKENLPDAASPNQIQKKKIWELVQPHLRTDDSCIAALGTATMVTISGAVSSKTLKNARIS